ncbi:MAG: beta-galactosidase trimerization domain-containing protein, partial [Planctomycetota bacterium]
DLFTTSIHLSWHFEAACGEVDRPVYFQSRQTRDYFKGGWTSAYETTGGAVQYSGGYPNSMNPGLMRRLMCNYLAAGHVNIAFWTWNNRPGGWEAGEYGMTSLSGKVTSWASQAGQIARAMGKYHRELWSARQENPVGVLEDWDTQAVYTLEPDRHDLTDGPGRFGGGTQLQPIWAMIGASRALVNHHRAFQYVRTEELGDGIGPAYPVLYAPHLRALSTEALENLLAYVEAGGRLVADVQFGFQDPWGKCHPAGEGGPVERIFGAWIDVIHHTRTEQMQLGDMPIDGYFADVETTDAKVLARFADGRAAVTEVRRGKGSAVLVGFDLARMCTRPGNAQAEAYLAQLTTGHMQRTWQCDAPLAFRLRSQQADHYFLINDGPARAAFIQAFDRQYTEGVDAITGEPVDVAQSMVIDLPAESACWIRLA